MTERSREIFGNAISRRDYQKAVHSKEKYARKFGDDSRELYPVEIEDNPVIGDRLGVKDIRLGQALRSGEQIRPADFDHRKGLIVGNIRMGFGHYRISMAMASAAHALGYTPYWMDLNSYPQTTATKLISAQNDLYSLGSRLSRFKVFNKLVWEPMNYEGFRALTYNASDQKKAELMAPLFREIPKDIPLLATHVWPAQAALHGGMRYVVNAIPDNWPMALHLAEGSLHTVQCNYAYQGYRTLYGFAKKKVLRSIPPDQLIYTGHYVDHEIVANVQTDCQARIERKKRGEPMRFLLTIGGAGAQRDLFSAIIRHLLPAVRNKRAALYVNVGDYRNVWEELLADIPELGRCATERFLNFEEAAAFADGALTDSVEGVHAFYHRNIFEAVYITNLLMRSCDLLVTKPSELAFYPVPKLFIRRVGKHEMWGAIHSAEMGDGSLECRDIPHILQMTDLFLGENRELIRMCENIQRNKDSGLYNGAYRAVELAMHLREKS